MQPSVLLRFSLILLVSCWSLSRDRKQKGAHVVGMVAVVGGGGRLRALFPPLPRLLTKPTTPAACFCGGLGRYTGWRRRWGGVGGYS